jgi:hypothetical protein
VSFSRISRIKSLSRGENVHSRMVVVQGAAEITPTFQRGITNKWYQISPKAFHFPNVDITKFFYFRFSKLYRPNGGRDGRYTFGAVLLE